MEKRDTFGSTEEERIMKNLNEPKIQIFGSNSSRKMETRSPGGRIAERGVNDLQSKRAEYNKSKKN